MVTKKVLKIEMVILYRQYKCFGYRNFTIKQFIGVNHSSTSCSSHFGAVAATLAYWSRHTREHMSWQQRRHHLIYEQDIGKYV